MEKSIKVYTAGTGSLSVLASLQMALSDIYSARFVIWQLFMRDFVTQFRQKLLGYLWAILAPLLAIASFVFMMMTGYLKPGDTSIPYPVFVFIGIGFWTTMVSTLQSVAAGLLNNGDLLIRTNVPPIALAIAGLAGLFYNILMNTLVLFLVLWANGYAPSAFVLLYPLLMLPFVMLGLGMGLFLAVVGTVARDITTVVTTALNLLMYLTPVIYEAKFGNPILKTIVAMNPLTHLIEFSRNLVCLGEPRPLLPYLISVLLTIIVLMLGVHSFYLIKDKVAERL